MSAYDSGRYGTAVGDYDLLYPGVESDTAAAVDLLVELASSFDQRSLLEFGIGTGRLALPLQERGVNVTGIDGSEAMLARFRSKPGSGTIKVALGDYRDARMPGVFGVVVLALNGIFDPRGLDAQRDIFRNAADHLAPGGFFVVESWVMTDAQRGGDWTVIPRFVGDRHVEFQLSRYEIESNSIERTLVHLRQDGLHFVTVDDTYASPAELDVIAYFTGFTRVARYSNWQKAAYTAASRNQISIFQRVSDGALAASPANG